MSQSMLYFSSSFPVIALQYCCLDLDPAFEADHPFFFFIQDHQSGMIYFAGRLTKP